MSKNEIIKNGKADLLWLAQSQFIPSIQVAVTADCLRGEEREFFARRMTEIRKIIEAMPATYESDASGLDAVAHVHYFGAGGDWWITEKDCEPEQLQAYGFVRLEACPEGAEFGYVSLAELAKTPGIELDYHFEPRPLREIDKIAPKEQPPNEADAVAIAEFESEYAA